MWHKNIDVTLRSFSKGHIDVLVKENGWQWRFTGIYGNPNRDLHHETWTLLKRLAEISTLPWLLGGDFNEITSLNEKRGGSRRLEKYMQKFREPLDSCDLIDPGFTGLEFIWCNNHVNNDIIWERLDRFLMNSDLQERCSLIDVQHLAFLASDHRLILADWREDVMDRTNQGQRRPIRLEEV